MNSHQQASSEGSVVILIDQRAFFVVAATLGLVVVFVLGLFIGAGQKTRIADLQTAAGQLRGQVGAPAQDAAASQIQNPAFWQQPPTSDNTAIKRPAAAHAPDGDHPHLALPGLEKTDYVLNITTAASIEEKIQDVVTLKDTGNRDLMIENTSST